MIKIYSLTHPSSTRIYIGKTCRELKRRLYGHMDESARHLNLRKNKWIRSLVEKGLAPEINLISEVPDADGDNAERYYIKLGWQLAPEDMLNSPNAMGGEGFQKGHNISKEARSRSAANRRKLTNEQLQTIAARINSGEYMNDMAVEYGVERRTLIRNLNGRTNSTVKIKYKKHRPSGLRHGNSKINQEIASDIRGKYSSGELDQHQLAKEYGLAQSTIWSIIQNKTWKTDKVKEINKCLQ